MPDAYATAQQLADFLTADALTTVTAEDQDRLLLRASELLDDTVTTPFEIDDATFLPTDSDIATAMQDACCAQIEFWLEVGEDHDVAGLANRRASIGHLSLDALPPELAPRAARILRTAGLMSTSTATSTAGQFFGAA